MSEDYHPVREAITRSLFSKFDESGVREDTYVGHVKIWEDVPDEADEYNEATGMKPRYLMVSSASVRCNNLLPIELHT